MKESRDDRRKVTIRYRHDGVSRRTTLLIDVEVPEDEMPHEHRQELKQMAEELLGVPLGSLPDDVVVTLRRPDAARADDHDHDHEREREAAEETAPTRREGMKT